MVAFQLVSKNKEPILPYSNSRQTLTVDKEDIHLTSLSVDFRVGVPIFEGQ
jgi:hypothetical protein